MTSRSRISLYQLRVGQRLSSAGGLSPNVSGPTLPVCESGMAEVCSNPLTIYLPKSSSIDESDNLPSPPSNIVEVPVIAAEAALQQIITDIDDIGTLLLPTGSTEESGIPSLSNAKSLKAVSAIVEKRSTDSPNNSRTHSSVSFLEQCECVIQRLIN